MRKINFFIIFFWKFEFLTVGITVTRKFEESVWIKKNNDGEILEFLGQFLDFVFTYLSSGLKTGNKKIWTRFLVPRLGKLTISDDFYVFWMFFPYFKYEFLANQKELAQFENSSMILDLFPINLAHQIHI